MRERLLTNWHTVRVIQLIMGLSMTVAAIVQKEGILGLFGGMLLLQSVFNTGCCAGGSCAIPAEREKADKREA